MKLLPGNPMARVLRAILVFEAVVYALSVAGMIQVSGLAVSTSFAIGLGAAALALASAGLLGRSFGYPLAWFTQAVGIGLGFATDMMFWVGGMFALLWTMTFVLGRRIEVRPEGPAAE